MRPVLQKFSCTDGPDEPYPLLVLYDSGGRVKRFTGPADCIEVMANGTGVDGEVLQQEFVFSSNQSVVNPFIVRPFLFAEGPPKTGIVIGATPSDLPAVVPIARTTLALLALLLVVAGGLLLARARERVSGR